LLNGRRRLHRPGITTLGELCPVLSCGASAGVAGGRRGSWGQRPPDSGSRNDLHPGWGARLTHTDPWKLVKLADDSSPALAGILSPSDGERDRVRGLTAVPWPTPIHARGSGVVSLLLEYRRAAGSGTPPVCADLTHGFRWSFPPCPERPPATLWQPCGLATAPAGPI
jgi:hypothetical protein